MSSRDYLKHIVDVNPARAVNAGDEFYNPTTNKLFKTVLVNGTTSTQNEVAFNNPNFNFDNLKATNATVQNTASTNTTANNSLTVSGGIGANSIYVASRIGIGNTTSSIIYQTYNPATQTIDTIFG
jgi:hypothetical protein